MRALLNKKGLTLIEILVTVLVLAIIMGMIASIFGFMHVSIPVRIDKSIVKKTCVSFFLT